MIRIETNFKSDEEYCEVEFGAEQACTYEALMAIAYIINKVYENDLITTNRTIKQEVKRLIKMIQEEEQND